MSVARRATAAALPRARRRACCSAVALFGLARARRRCCSVLLDRRRSATGWPHARLGLPHQLRRRAIPTSAGAQPAILGTLWLIGDLRAASSSRSASATAIYLEEYADSDALVQPPDRAQHPEPRRGALDRLRHPRARVPRARPARPRAASCSPAALTLGAAGAADRDHRRRARRSARCRRSIREGALALGATQWQTIWRQVLPAAIPGIATGVDPRALARDRRDRAADRSSAR